LNEVGADRLPGDPLPQKVRRSGACPECGAEDLFEYPVLAAAGWFTVVKCQRCLCSVSREPWNRLGWISLAEEGL
jgi:vanillate/4-hydroxybenzoate decarboxylase subunit D